MDHALQYQGLFYLSAGAFAFLLLAVIFRSLGAKENAAGRMLPERDEWLDRAPLRLVEIIAETHDVKTFRFTRADGRAFPLFAAGQFLSFQIGDDPKTLRSYSISSSSLSRAVVSVSVKRLPNGFGSGWFHQRKVGDLVWAFPPSGHFTETALEDEPRVFIAGGIGITPFLSMIQSAIDAARGHSITLFYGMRTLDDMAYHPLLNLLASRHSQFHYIPVVSSSIREQSWSGATGYIGRALLRQHTLDTPRTHYFFCGPSVMTETLIAELVGEGVPSERIHEEKFASPTQIDLESLPRLSAQLEYLGQTYQYNGKLSVLEALEEHGVELPYACRVGVCGSCKCLIEGAVLELTDTGLTPTEKKRGAKLACVSYPKGDLKIDVLT